jgi:hypothetical protein
MLRNLKVRMTISVLMLLPFLLLGCSVKPPDPVVSFKSAVEDFLKVYKQSKHEEVYYIQGGLGTYSFEPSTPSGWKKTTSDLVSDAYSIDVQKTNSLVTPDIGTVEFDTSQHSSNFQDSEKDARDTQVVSDDVVSYHHRHTYAFQDGVWIEKSQKQMRQGSSTWVDCKEGE